MRKAGPRFSGKILSFFRPIRLTFGLTLDEIARNPLTRLLQNVWNNHQTIPLLARHGALGYYIASCFSLALPRHFLSL